MVALLGSGKKTEDVELRTCSLLIGWEGILKQTSALTIYPFRD